MMEYTIYKAGLDDLDQIMDIITDAKELLRNSGSTQWNNSNNYPNYETFKTDILNQNCFVLKMDNKIVAVETIELSDDSYNIIDGAWLSKINNYGVVHRLAVKKGYHNKKLGDILIAYAIDYCREKNLFSIRIDTHKLNQAVQKIVQRNGFVYCGIITLLRSTEDNKRLAYEKIL